MTENVLAVLRQSHINFGPLKAILDTALQGGTRVLRCLVCLAAVDHDLERARRLNGFEKRKLRSAPKPRRKCGDGEQPKSERDPQSVFQNPPGEGTGPTAHGNFRWFL